MYRHSLLIWEHTIGQTGSDHTRVIGNQSIGSVQSELRVVFGEGARIWSRFCDLAEEIRDKRREAIIESVNQLAIYL